MLVVLAIAVIENDVLRQDLSDPDSTMHLVFGLDRNDVAIMSSRSHLGRRLIGNGSE
jgi:hypothetical protein